MQHFIDPKIDCVFKALLGAEENRNLLIHFLNAFLAQELVEPLVWVEIDNPYNDREYIGDKLSVVDVKAQDSHNRTYQIEIQLTNNAHLPVRIVYNWADIYSQQLQSGDDYAQLQATYSIWLLAEKLLPNDADYAHHYKLRDEFGKTLCETGGIWLFELSKFDSNTVETEEQRWLKFFKYGQQLNDNALPDWMSTPEMKQAMSTLSKFSEKQSAYFQYQARQEFIRIQNSTQRELREQKQALAEALQREAVIQQREAEAQQQKQAAQQREAEAQQQKQAAQQREAEAQQQKQAALDEVAYLRNLLAQKDDKPPE